MLQLMNGCTCSEPAVFPSNWKTGGNSLLKKDWYIQYYFRDPQFADKYKYGKQVRIKGMNAFSSLEARRAATADLLEYELHRLQNLAYNPIAKTKQADQERTDYEIEPDTPWLVALEKAYKRLQVKSDGELKRTVRIVGLAARQLNYGTLPIKDIRRKHIKIILEHLQKTRPQPAKDGKKETTWGAASYNRFRAHLMSIFRELMDLEAIESDPVSSLKKQVETPAKREVLTVEEQRIVSSHLKANYYTFWRYMMMFFHSGARSTELLLLKAKDVDLQKQTFKIEVLKGKKKRATVRAIMDEALPLWHEILQDTDLEHYLFSKGLEPGQEPIRPEQIKRRWREHVKVKLNINKDFYGLKYLHTDQVAAELGLEAAAAHDGHTSTAMVKKIYAQGHEERERKKIQKLSIKFGG